MAVPERRTMRDQAPLRAPRTFLNLPPQQARPGINFPVSPHEDPSAQDSAEPSIDSLAAGQQQGRDALARRDEAAKRQSLAGRERVASRMNERERKRQAVERANNRDQESRTAAATTMGGLRPLMPQQPAPPSGMLPGEEQVTTTDTLGQLSSAERAALQAKYQQSGMAGTGGMETFEDWASTHFGEMPPDERLSAMRRATNARMPAETIVPQEHVEPGKNSRLAKGIVEAGGVLPEGRDPSQYGPNQRHWQGRNVHNPHAAMTPFGGTNTFTPEGGMGARAPNPAMLDRVGPPGPDGQYSNEQILRLGQAYNIDVGKYGNDTDVLRAHVLREHVRHQRLMTKYNIIPTGMGGYRYTAQPVPAPAAATGVASDGVAPAQAGVVPVAMRPKAADGSPAPAPAGPRMIVAPMAAQSENLKTRMFARDLRKKFGGLPGADTDPAMLELERLAAEGAGADYPALVALGLRLAARRDGLATQTYRNRLQNETLGRDMMRPGYSRGMAQRSIQKALRDGDIAGAVAWASQSGNHPLAETLAAMHGADVAGATQLGVAKAGQNKPTLADQFKEQREAAMREPAGEPRVRAMMTVLAQMAQATGMPIDEPTARKQAEAMIAEGMAATSPSSPEVKKRLLELKNDRIAFMAFLDRMGITDPAVKEQKWREAGGAWRQMVEPAMASAGLAAIPGIGGLLPLVGSLLGGLIPRPADKK